MKSYYFGCIKGHPGHYLHTSGLHRVFDSGDMPISPSALDRGLLYNTTQAEGLARLVHIDGWSILSFWDRSADSRVNSNSAFLINQILEFEEMLTQCKSIYPSIFNRIKFEIKLFERKQ